MQKIILGIALIVLSLSILGFRVYKGVILKQNVTGHLKRAGDANTIDLAKEELNYVINFLDKNNIKSRGQQSGIGQLQRRQRS